MSRHAVYALTLILLTLFAYSPIWTAGWVYEDGSAVLETTIQGTAPIAPLRARALTRASYRLDKWVGHGQPWAFHADNLLLHLANGALVGVVTSELLFPPAGWVAATCFLLHPMNAEAVSYVAGRTEVLSALFALVTLLLVVKGGRGQWLAPVTFALAVSAKESSIVIVPLIVWYLLLYRPSIAEAAARLRLWSWPMLPILATVTVGFWISRSVITKEYLVQSDLSTWRYFLVQATAFWRYVAMVIIPVGQSAEHPFDALPYAVHLTAGVMLICAVCLALLPAFFGWTRRGLAIVFGLGWIAVALGPRFVMRIPEIVNEHQLYLWMIGWAIVAAALMTPAREMDDAKLA